MWAAGATATGLAVRFEEGVSDVSRQLLFEDGRPHVRPCVEPNGRLSLHGSHGGVCKVAFSDSPGVRLTHMAHEHLREEEGSPYFEEGGVIFSLKAKEP